MRDKLYQTRERARHLLSQGTSDIPEEATYINIEQVFKTFHEALLRTVIACTCSGLLSTAIYRMLSYSLLLFLFNIKKEDIFIEEKVKFQLVSLQPNFHLDMVLNGF